MTSVEYAKFGGDFYGTCGTQFQIYRQECAFTPLSFFDVKNLCSQKPMDMVCLYIYR